MATENLQLRQLIKFYFTDEEISTNMAELIISEKHNYEI